MSLPKFLPTLAAAALIAPVGLAAPAVTADAAPAAATRTYRTQTCKASFYHEPQMTASGERFNPNAMTAAHRSFPLGSRVRVTNPRTKKSVIVRINDRGPYAGNRCIDLSRAAFKRIGNLNAGVMTVRMQRIR